MEHSVVGQVQRAFGLWGQACLVLLKDPILLLEQVVFAFLLVALRKFMNFAGVAFFNHLIFFYAVWILYFFNNLMSHHTRRAAKGKPAGYIQSSGFAFLRSNPFLLLFIPFIYFFEYKPSIFSVPYGQKLFFASLGVERFTQYINISVARILFVLLVALLLFIFIVQHVALVVMWSGENSYKQTISRAWHLLRHNAVTIISLTCWLFLSSFLSLVLLRMAILTIPNWLNLTMAYYIMTVSINLYCMALTILYYDNYVKHERAVQ